jgi:hypothetical protein
LRVYHFLNEKYGLCDLQHRRLKLARINDLNDPFEFLVSANPRKTREAFDAVKKHNHDWFGILCFCQDWKNPVQWAHYADSHKGMCLGFDVSRSIKQIAKITYSKNRIRPDLTLLASNNEKSQAHYEEIMNTKYIHWQYENEVRLFCDLNDSIKDGDLSFYTFDDLLSLKEVIVGYRSALKKRDIIHRLGSLAQSVSVSKARPSFSKYEMAKERRPMCLKSFLE